LCSALLKSRASAHGDPAAVLGVVQNDVEGRPRVLRLSEGLAILTDRGGRYLCPALFDSDVTPRAAALASGPTLVASALAVFLLQDDGTVAPHPDPAARAGAIRALDASADGVFALRAASTGAELVRLTESTVEVLASVPGDFASLAAEDGGVLITGLTRDGRALQRGFYPDGRERAEWTAEAQVVPDAVAALARLAAEVPYVLVLAGDGPTSELLRLDGAGQSELVQRASIAIHGPLVTAPDHVSLAFDGKLAELSGATVTLAATDAPVTCLSRVGGFSYACMSTQLVTLRDGAPAERVFGLEELLPPDLSALPPALADRCTLQWLRFRVDLSGAGVVLQDLDAGAPAAGDAGGNDAGGSGDATAESDAGKKSRASDGGCAVRRLNGANGGERGASGWMALAALAWAQLRRVGRIRA
jgi:hypothetical protein